MEIIMRIAICGLGKAGKELAKRIINDNNNQLILGLCREESCSKNQDVGDMLNMSHQNIPILSLRNYSLKHNNYDIDVIIDFSNKETSMKLVRLCNEIGVNVVVCTTNLTDQQCQEIRNIAEKNNCGVLTAPNLTIGINLLIEFVSKISKMLPTFDFEIIERHRCDKPRVTTTARIISKAIDRGDTPISSIRVGGYVGIHEVTAASEYERLTIIHESFTRGAFAEGAMLAANYLHGKKGYYTMDDVIRELENSILGKEVDSQ